MYEIDEEKVICYEVAANSKPSVLCISLTQVPDGVDSRASLCFGEWRGH